MLIFSKNVIVKGGFLLGKDLGYAGGEGEEQYTGGGSQITVYRGRGGEGGGQDLSIFPPFSIPSCV